MRCQECQREFSPRHPKARFCGSSCRWASWRRLKGKGGQAERVLRELVGKVEEAVQEAREALAALGGRPGP